MHDVFYFTDIHGQSWLYNEVMKLCTSDPEATIIFGGDAADRGPHGYPIMKNLLDNPQVVYLKGNHEELFVNAAKEILNDYSFNDKLRHSIHNIKTKDDAEDVILDVQYTHQKNVSLHILNGGMPTLIDWLLNGAPTDIIDRINKLPICFSYENYDFCHAGGGFAAFTDVETAEYYGRTPEDYAARTCLWDRNCFNLGWAHNRICVHGHTPTCYLNIPNNRIHEIEDCRPIAWVGKNSAKYDGCKIDMDTGTIYSGKIYVLNVLTDEVYGFFDKDYEHPEKEAHMIVNNAPYKILE